MIVTATALLCLSTVAACGSDEPASADNAHAAAGTDSTASHCGAPSTSRLEAIAKQFDPQFKDDGLEDAYEYRIDDARSVVSAVVKRPTEATSGPPTAWLLSGDSVDEQLTGRVDLHNPLGDFVARPPALPGGNAEKWEFEWRECDSLVPSSQRTKWAPATGTSLSPAPRTCDGAESLDKVPGVGFELKDGLRLVDIYRPYDQPYGSVFIGGNVVDDKGTLIAQGAVWKMAGRLSRSANQAAIDTSNYRKALSFNYDHNVVAVIERCAKAAVD